MHGTNQFIPVVVICLMASFSVQAAPTSANFRPYQGTFTGIAIGDSDTSAPLTLNLIQRNSTVVGTATVENGIKVNTGGFIRPGLVAVPSGTINVNGNVSSQDPRHLEAQSGLSAYGLSITAKVVSEISLDNNMMNVQLILGIPWPCRSTTLKATLVRSQ